MLNSARAENPNNIIDLGSINATVIVLTKNEEENINKCLDSVSRFAEVFVVDSSSEDSTQAMAGEYSNTTVVNWAWNGKFPKKKQWAIDNLDISEEWVLMLDADEEMTPELADEIACVVESASDKAAYFIHYDNYFLGRRLKHGSHSMKLILFKRGKARFVPTNEILVSTMWEVEGNYQPLIDGEVGVLKGHAIHKDCKSLFHYYQRHNRYSDLEAVHRLKLGKIEESYPPFRRTLKRILRKLPGSGFLYFCHSYILKLGFLDGLPGLAFAFSRLVYFTQIECKVMELRLHPERLDEIMKKHDEVSKALN